MRHRKRRSKLSMKTARRNATIANMVRSLIRYQKIETTLARAKEARRLAERMISLGKSDTVSSRRMAYSVLTDRDMVSKLFKEVAPLFKDRQSGFTRIIPLGFRRGDGATLAILELTEKKIVEKLPRKKKIKAEEANPETAAAHEEKKAEPKVKAAPKTAAKTKPTLAEEKRTEKAKTEDKKIADKKGFMKNLRGFFRRKTDM